MTSKISTETVSPNKAIGDNLNYSFNYVYDDSYAHRLISAGDHYYKYDANGNIICEQDGSFESNGEELSYHKITQESENVYSTDYGWGLFKEDDKGSSGKANRTKYKRTYVWNERNQLVSSVDDSYSTAYIYGQDGQRSNKYTQNSETLYFNKMWTLHTDSGNNIYGGQTAKNIYLGDTRIVTKLNSGTNPTYQEEYYKQYYYHSDHLGSATLISDYKGDEYQRIEYTPYGETWVEKTSNTGLEWLPYKFTAKELDEETGLYYYGARYLDPKYSMWISTDPALGEYIPKAPIDEEAKKYNQNLPGMGGVFNHINGNLYAYAANNPVHYIDPDGNSVAIGIVGILLAASAVVMYYSLPIVHESQRQISDEIFYGAYNLRKTFTFSLSQKAESKSTAKQNPLIQQPVTATPGAPMPNNGDGNQHGNEEHDNSIERKLKEIKEQGATDIRKNQAQVDAKGNKVGKNRPDLQWNDANGKHHCWEVDHNPSNSVRHGNVILSNDPNAILELELLY